MRTKDEAHSSKFNKLLKGKKIDSCRSHYVTKIHYVHRPKVIILGRPSTFLIGELTRYVVHHPHRALVKT